VHFVATVLLATLATACFAKPPRPADGDPDAAPSVAGWLDGYAFRKHVTVTSGITGPLANFPVGVVRSDADLLAHARSDGRDIVATAADGETLLATELAAYDAGNLELWVKLPELVDANAFYLYYDGDAQPASTSVWDAPVFAGVWHLSDIGTARDSTSQGNHLNASGAAIPTTVPGVFGSARSLDGDDQLNGGDPADGSLDFGGDSFSYSLWVHQSQLLGGGFDTPFYKGGASSNEPGYCWLLGSANWTAKIHDGTNAADPELGLASTFQNRWVHIAAVIDRAGGTISVFADGAQTGGQSLTARAIDSVSTVEAIQVGRGNMEPFTGLVDEVRIYKTAVTQEWLAAEVNNGTAPMFLTLGPEEAKP